MSKQKHLVFHHHSKKGGTNNRSLYLRGVRIRLIRGSWLRKGEGISNKKGDTNIRNNNNNNKVKFFKKNLIYYYRYCYYKY